MDIAAANLHYCDMSIPAVHIRRLARFHCAPDWSWETEGESHWTGESARPVRFNFNLWTVLQGGGELKAPESTYALSGGDCFILRGGAHYAATHDSEDPLTVFAVHFDYLNMGQRVVRPAGVRLHRRVEHLEFFTHVLERMETAWVEGDEADADFWLRACLLEIERQDREASRHGPKREQARRVDAICRDIRTDPAAEWRVDELAERLHCTRHHFARLFREFKGVTAQDFIVAARIEAAKGLLHSSSYTIGRIAEIVGYRDIYFFSRQFRQKTGMSPSEYRDGC